MHHTKEFSKYSTQKKMWLIVAIIAKFVVFLVVFAGLVFLLRDYTSPLMLIILVHVILFACLFVFLFIHKNKALGSHEHTDECK